MNSLLQPKTAALPPIEHFEVQQRRGLKQLRLAMVRAGKNTDDQVAAFITEFLKPMVPRLQKGSPNVRIWPGQPVSPGLLLDQYIPTAEYNGETDVISIDLVPGIGLALDFYFKRDDKDAWARFVKQWLTVATHEMTHREEVRRGLADRSPEDQQKHLQKMEDNYVPYKDGDVGYHLQPLEVKAFARGAVSELRNAGMKRKEIEALLRDKKEWGTLSARSNSFARYDHLKQDFRAKLPKDYMRPFVDQMLRALRASDKQASTGEYTVRVDRPGKTLVIDSKESESGISDETLAELVKKNTAGGYTVKFRSPMDDGSLPEYQIRQKRASSKMATTASARWFHGTSREAAKWIKQDGALVPQGAGMSRFGGGLAPREGAIYVTNDLEVAFNYARDADGEGRGVVFEVTVPNVSQLLPDEDAIAAALKYGHIGGDYHAAAEVRKLWMAEYGGDAPSYDVSKVFQTWFEEEMYEGENEEWAEVTQGLAENIAKQNPSLASDVIESYERACYVGRLPIKGTVDATGRLRPVKKIAYVAPTSGELSITIQDGERPKVTLSLDLGIPNFTRFSISVPVENLQNSEIDMFCRQAFEALLQNVTAFLVSMKYSEELAAQVLANAEDAFISLDADAASDADMPDQDRRLRLYEAAFDLPEEFAWETREKVVTASVVRRVPQVRKIELIPLDQVTPTGTPAKTIEFYLDQATRSTPRAFAVNVVEQAAPGKGKDWEKRRVVAGTVPQFLYHGTFEHHLPSIIANGLGGTIGRRNFDVSGTGVYLSDDPEAADNWVSDNEFGTQGSVIVLTVDTARLDKSKLRADGNDADGERGGTSYVYRGVIPASFLNTLDGDALDTDSDNV